MDESLCLKVGSSRDRQEQKPELSSKVLNKGRTGAEATTTERISRGSRTYI